MDRNIKISKLVQNCLGSRKVMFVPILCVSTFMMVGYAALDKEAPVINTNRVEVLYGENFDYSILDIQDNRDSRSAISVEADLKQFNNTRLGSYDVKVFATDTFSNVSEKTIKVDVVDKFAPNLVVSQGLNTVSTDGYVVQVAVNEDNSIDRYVKAIDNVDGDISAFIDASQPLNTSELGSQIIELTVADLSGNIARKTVEFYVTDMEAPVLTYLDGENVIVDYGSTFNPLDYLSVTDNYDKDIEKTIEVSQYVRTNSLHEEDVIVKAKDSSGNIAELPLHVKVADISGPTISFRTSYLSVSIGENVDVKKYVTAYDNYDGNVTNNIQVGTVNTSSWGNKSVKVSVTDSSGNTTTRTFTVYVKPPANIGIAEIAKSKIGCPYVYGATGPNAFDCSGFAYWVYRQAGIYLPRALSSQWKSGVPISFSDIKPGDLLFYNTHGGVSHVGIYIGGGQMVHAGTEQTGVTTANIYGSYWTSRYLGARRVA